MVKLAAAAAGSAFHVNVRRIRGALAWLTIHLRGSSTSRKCLAKSAADSPLAIFELMHVTHLAQHSSSPFARHVGKLDVRDHKAGASKSFGNDKTEAPQGHIGRLPEHYRARTLSVLVTRRDDDWPSKSIADPLALISRGLRCTDAIVTSDRLEQAGGHLNDGSDVGDGRVHQALVYR